MSKKEITVKEARDEFHYSKQQLYNLLDSGEIKSRKVGGYLWLIDRASLARYIAEKGTALRGQVRSKKADQNASTTT